MLRSLHEGVVALHFRVPKEGQSYDTSEMVFLFERAVRLCVDFCICASVRVFTLAHRLHSDYSPWHYLHDITQNAIPEPGLPLTMCVEETGRRGWVSPS